jgi:multicomponent Na+:H+ antiporter subunit D
MIILLVLLVPISGALLILITKKAQEYIAIAVSLLSFMPLLATYPEISAGGIAYQIHIILDLHLVVDTVTWTILSFVSFLYILIIVYSTKYITKNKGRYYTLLLLTMGSTSGSFLSHDILTFYLFFEMTTLFSFFLVLHRGTKRARNAGFLYLIICLIGGAFILISAALVYAQNGNGAFSSLDDVSSSLFILGCLIKAGAFPLHFWLPEAHPAAPSPISAFLSAVMIKIGIYGIARFCMIHGDISWLPLIAVLSMLFGVVLALIQNDIKRILAYSSISQIGYMLLGMNFSSLGIAGGLFHLINHALFKGLLFLCMGAVIYATGERKLERLGGLYKKMPYTAFACIVASAAISGIPFLNGCVSKIVIYSSFSDPLLKIAFILTCAGTLALFLKLNKNVFFGTLPDHLRSAKEAPPAMLLPMIALTLSCILIGLFPLSVFKNLSSSGFEFWRASQFLETGTAIIVGMGIFIIGKRTGFFEIKGYSMRNVYATFADFSDSFCKKINSIFTRDINIYILCILLFFILLFFL